MGQAALISVMYASWQVAHVARVAHVAHVAPVAPVACVNCIGIRLFTNWALTIISNVSRKTNTTPALAT